MDRIEFLKQMAEKAEKLYDLAAPHFWTVYGLYNAQTHQEFLNHFLQELPPDSHLLSAGCGAGRWDGDLINAGHSLLGIDQSEGMLKRAREKFPRAEYRQMKLQEMNFQAEFDGTTCIDALEHVPPEAWPVILQAFHRALKPGGLLYFTVDTSETPWALQASFERARSMGLPVVYGEVADRVDECYEKFMATNGLASDELSDPAVYHFHPALEQVKQWLDEAGFAVEKQGRGKWYAHFLVRMRS
jgi:ubiquinone/menaquinone biosynthesis C-methylase UbiE